MKMHAVSESFIERWKTFYGEDRTQQILNYLDRIDPRIITPNKLKTTTS